MGAGEDWKDNGVLLVGGGLEPGTGRRSGWRKEGKVAGGGPFLPYSLLGPMDRERRARAYADASIGMETGALWTTGVERTARGSCLLYTSDAADDLTRVDLGGRRILK